MSALRRVQLVKKVSIRLFCLRFPPSILNAFKMLLRPKALRCNAFDGGLSNLRRALPPQAPPLLSCPASWRRLFCRLSALTLILALCCLGALTAHADEGDAPAAESACVHPGWQNGVCVACGAACPHAEHDYYSCVCFACGMTVGHSYLTSCCPMCGRVPDYIDSRVPYEFFSRSEYPGTVEAVEYLTRDYVGERKGAGTLTYYKRMLVYLPYGYDASKPYNVLVLLHGMGGNENYWLGKQQLYAAYDTDSYVYTSRMLDNMFAAGMCRDMIIVTPTFYRSSANLSRYDRIPDEEQFVRELREDILPCIVQNYATYAADGSAEAISEARDHFAYAGLSMGSIYAYNSVMPLCLDEFAWFGCFSGSDCYVDLAADALGSETNAAYPIRYFYNSIGTLDSMATLHRENFIALTDRVDGLTDTENAWFTQLPGLGHEYSAWIVGLYNFLQVVFMM